MSTRKATAWRKPSLLLPMATRQEAGGLRLTAYLELTGANYIVCCGCKLTAQKLWNTFAQLLKMRRDSFSLVST